MAVGFGGKREGGDGGLFGSVWDGTVPGLMGDWSLSRGFGSAVSRRHWL